VKRKTREDGADYYIIEEGNRNPPNDMCLPVGHDHPLDAEAHHEMEQLPRLNQLFKSVIEESLNPMLVWSWTGTMSDLTRHVAAVLQKHPYTCSYHLVRDPVLLERWSPTLKNYVKKRYKTVKKTCISHIQYKQAKETQARQHNPPWPAQMQHLTGENKLPTIARDC
jgi:hypothetical protein